MKSKKVRLKDLKSNPPKLLILFFCFTSLSSSFGGHSKADVYRIANIQYYIKNNQGVIDIKPSAEMEYINIGISQIMQNDERVTHMENGYQNYTVYDHLILEDIDINYEYLLTVKIMYKDGRTKTVNKTIKFTRKIGSDFSNC